MTDVPDVAEAQRRNELSGDHAGFGGGGAAPGGLHSLQPVDEAATSAVLHDYEAHLAHRPFRNVLVDEGVKSHNVFVL